MFVHESPFWNDTYRSLSLGGTSLVSCLLSRAPFSIVLMHFDVDLHDKIHEKDFFSVDDKTFKIMKEKTFWEMVVVTSLRPPPFCEQQSLVTDHSVLVIGRSFDGDFIHFVILLHPALKRLFHSGLPFSILEPCSITK